MKLLKRTYRLTKEQDKTLKKTAKKFKISQSEVIRQILENLKDQQHD